MLDVVMPVHNGAPHVTRHVQAWLAQRGAGIDWDRVIVVDDGSTDATLAQLRAISDPRLVVIASDSCQGRSAARNRGWRASAASAVLFVDADCMPDTPEVAARHAAMLRSGAELSFGRIDGQGGGFWERHAARTADARERAAEAGDFVAMTSCNTAVNRARLASVGGFREAYRHYGFEDRDLLATLTGQGVRCCYDRQARVRHRGDTSVAALCAKMHSAGRYSAAVFHLQHPQLYAASAYARFDAVRGPWLTRAFGGAAQWLGRPVAGLAQWATQSALFGDLPARWLVRLAMGLAYLHGTRSAGDR